MSMTTACMGRRGRSNAEEHDNFFVNNGVQPIRHSVVDWAQLYCTRWYNVSHEEDIREALRSWWALVVRSKKTHALDRWTLQSDTDTYRPFSDPSLCVTEDGFDKESRPLRLRPCNGGIKQKWVNQGWKDPSNNRIKDPSISFNYNKQKPLEIHPESNMNKCVTQMHHSKAHERVFIRSCEKPRKHDTSMWVTYKN